MYIWEFDKCIYPYNQHLIKYKTIQSSQKVSYFLPVISTHHRQPLPDSIIIGQCCLFLNLKTNSKKSLGTGFFCSMYFWNEFTVHISSFFDTAKQCCCALRDICIVSSLGHCEWNCYNQSYTFFFGYTLSFLLDKCLRTGLLCNSKGICLTL